MKRKVFTKKYRRIIQITVYIFLLLFFIVLLFANWYYAGKPIANESEEVNKSFSQIALANVPNIFSLVSGLIAVATIIIVDIKKGIINALKILCFSVIFTGLWLGTVYAQEFNVSVAFISLIAMVIFTILGMIIIWPRHFQYTDNESKELRKIFKGIANDKIASIQLYDVFAPREATYYIKYRSSFTKDNFDINAILNQTLSFNKGDLEGFQAIIEKYNEYLVKIGNQGVTDRAVKVQKDLKEYINKNWVTLIEEDLLSIKNVSGIDQEHCIRAALYLFVKTIEKAMDNPKGTRKDILSSKDVFYGYDFKSIDLPIDHNCKDYKKMDYKLRHMLRTGLAISAVIDDKYSFCFPYENLGYKRNRQYCVFNIDNLKPTGSGYMCSICLIALKNVKSNTKVLGDEALLATISNIEEKIRTIFKA